MIKVRRVKKGDLSRMREVVESAFGDFFERQLGSRPRQVFGGAQYVHHRWLMEPWGCFVAEENEGKIVGVSLAVCWGTLGLFGPVAVLTPYQNQKVAQQLVRAAQTFFDENRVTLQGVVTFPYSPKHLVLYQKFDFKPRALVAITARSLDRREPGPPAKPVRGTPELKRFSTYEEGKKKALLGRLRALTGRIYRGLDLTKEIEIVDGLALGDTVLLEKDGSLLGFAICHTPGVSEAPQGALYIKYLAVDPTRRRPEHFVQLLNACEDFGINAACQRVIAPVYTGYWRAYQTLLSSGYHVDMLMLRMKRGKNDDYEREEDFVLDDWR
ncbi:MAG TPA: GNAT family N-acetyltransferase [Methylomirabilota bacterium]|jgi:ribosomal protein S18 acetylase RimI-like enzyme|nr:GNAT family N-acetyltransferase [Methylomirabilota bacterium]